MSAENIVRVKVNSRSYAVELFNPLDGMAFGLDVAAALGPALSGIYEATKDDGDSSKVFQAFALALRAGDFKGLFKRAFAQCYTPENERLQDEVAFNRWFRQYPGDMYELAARATFALVRDFFPPQLATIASGASERLNQAQAQLRSQSRSQKVGN